MNAIDAAESIGREATRLRQELAEAVETLKTVRYLALDITPGNATYTVMKRKNIILLVDAYLDERAQRTALRSTDHA